MTGNSPKSLTGGEALVGQLAAEGVTTLFGIPGVQLDWAVEALRAAANQVRYVVPRHEQATSYMADGYARAGGREGVCMVVPGPGVLNALSGLATAFSCNSRVLMIAGQIPSSALGRGYGMLHELQDQSGILRTLTKWHGTATRPAEVPSLVNEAFCQLRSGRPRPVAIEIPPDVMQARSDAPLLARAPEAPLAPAPDRIEHAASCLSGARFPVIQAGGGAMAAKAGAALRTLAERLQAPVVMSEGGRGVLDDRHPLALTSLGGRAVLRHADVVLVVGSRFLDATARPTACGERTRFIYLNVEPLDMISPRPPGIDIHADAKLGLEALLSALPATAAPNRSELMARVKAWSQHQIDAIEPQAAYVKALRQSMRDEDVLVSELTQVGYVANVAFPVHEGGRLLTPGYQGTLGFGFSAALGAAVANPCRRIVSINGDGGFGWGLQELATLARYALDVSVVVFVDGFYGNVRRIQRREFGADFAAELINPDLQQLGAAFGIGTEKVDSPLGLQESLSRARARAGPALIEVAVGEMPSPWSLIHAFVKPANPPPLDPLHGLVS
jgi:acetolactate synthase-1/2/3 large subunit